MNTTGPCVVRSTSRPDGRREMATASKTRLPLGSYVLSSRAVLINLRLGLMALFWVGIASLCWLLLRGAGL
jgi:hypothetical protein